MIITGQPLASLATVPLGQLAVVAIAVAVGALAAPSVRNLRPHPTWAANPAQADGKARETHRDDHA